MIKDLKPLEKWNVSNGENFELMFADLNLVTDAGPLKNWYFPKGRNFNSMFRGIVFLKNKNVIRGWDTDIEYMFEN